MYKSASLLVLAIIVGLAATSPAAADRLVAGSAAFSRGDYNRAVLLLLPAAERGNPRAQGLVGFMYATGKGVPQSYDVATYWYRLAAEGGDTTAQYLLGLAYDKGQGLPLDEVAAYKWLNLAAAHTSGRQHENYAKIRDAVASKMSRGQIAAGQRSAYRWPEDSRF